MTTCEPCAYSAINHSWGPSLAPFKTHCKKCHRSWRSLREGHCASCCAHFVNADISGYHFAGAKCTPPNEVKRRDGKARYAARETPQGDVFKVAYYGESPNFESFGTEPEPQSE